MKKKQHQLSIQHPVRKPSPSIAPGLEDDNLEIPADEEEIIRDEFTSVTKLVLDRLTDR